LKAPLPPKKNEEEEKEEAARLCKTPSEIPLVLACGYRKSLQCLKNLAVAKVVKAKKNLCFVLPT